METLLAAGTLASLGLAAYHHAAFPLALRGLTRLAPAPERPAPAAGPLPRITLLMPAYNEAAYIAEKIRNLAAIDYPAERLEVLVGCDGCTDMTAAIAREVGDEPECRHLRLQVVEFMANRGKVAVLNDLVRLADGEIVALSDVSALVSVDALQLAAAWFARPEIGVVCAGYRLLRPGSVGEAAYWRYQTAIKRAESRLGSTLGAHGALYLFRRDLFRQLPGDTINDDFILPMAIVGRGFRAVYEEEMVALELEQSDLALDRRRRRRIAAGNTQQVIRLLGLLHPRHGWTAFLFASGKVLRVLMPFLLAAGLLGSLALAPHSVLFALLAVLQLLLLGAATARALSPSHPLTRHFAVPHYLVSGHLAGLAGSLRYLAGLERGRWHRATLALESDR